MKILFCDFDGTVVNNMLSCWEKAMQATFLRFSKKPPTAAEYFMELESGDYLEVYHRRGITASRDQLNAIYEPIYNELNSRLNSSNIFPNVTETLRKLREKGTILVLLTASKKELVEPIVKNCGLQNIFNSIYANCLNKAEAIQRIIDVENSNREDREKIKPSECFFIGDAPSDIRHAKKAGVRSVAFYTGYIPAELLTAQQPQFFLANFKYLLFL